MSLPYLDIQGLDFEDEANAAACSRWKRPPRGAFGRAAMAAFFSRSAFCIGVSSGVTSSVIDALYPQARGHALKCGSRRPASPVHVIVRDRPGTEAAMGDRKSV